MHDVCYLNNIHKVEEQYIYLHVCDMEWYKHIDLIVRNSSVKGKCAAFRACQIDGFTIIKDGLDGC